jgi:hypothetical protein
MAFVGKYIDDVWAIREGSIVPPKDVANLSNAVYERAAQGFDRLLEDARTVMAAASTDLVRFAGWHFANRDWDTWSNVYLTVSGRPGKSRCMVGLYIGMGEREEFRLIGYLRLRPGTADSHKAFRDKCSRKLLGVHVPGDQKERYPAEWNDRYVIWLDERLFERTSRQTLEARLKLRSRRLFRRCRRLLRKNT